MPALLFELLHTRTQHTQMQKSPWLQNTGCFSEVWAHISSSQNLLHIVTSIQHRMWPLSVHKHNVSKFIQCSITPPSIPRLKYFYSACTIILMSIITPLTALPFLSLNSFHLIIITNSLLYISFTSVLHQTSLLFVSSNNGAHLHLLHALSSCHYCHYHTHYCDKRLIIIQT